MAGKKNKGKIIPLNAESIEDQIENGADPRLSMTPEQIQEFMRAEEEQLARRIGKFAAEVPQPDSSTVDEDNEEDEVFTVDLENKEIKQKEEALIVGDQGLVDKLLVAQANPYTDLITSIFVSKALGKLLATIRKEQSAVEDLGDKVATGPQAKVLREAARTYDKQMAELRACWITGTNQVKYDKIPEWAVSYINRYIDDRLRSLIDFASED